MRRSTPYDKKTALIVGDHPHAGEKAICLGVEIAAGKWGLIFKSTNNEETFFVFHKINIMWL